MNHGDDLTATATAWMDRWWDEDAGLLWRPYARDVHLVRETSWYALGLLQRDGPGDEGRAVRALATVVDHQYDEPGTVWHGTFVRSPEEPHPSGDATIWIDYDPNWRQFIGTTLLSLRRTYPGALDAQLAARVDRAVELAATSEAPDRVPPWYANIALMKAWLDVETGRAEHGESFGADVVAVFDEHGAFAEYNSPTYYGVDLWALALWRSFSSSDRLRAWGERIEEALWRDIARFYHAGLANLAGPYTRAYGMDMRSYAAQLGLWVWAALGREAAPFPDVATRFGHAADVCMAPLVTLAGARVPADVEPELLRFSGERRVERRIMSAIDRVATAWLGDTVMVGAERGDLGFAANDQFHPATVHWAGPDGSVGWVRVTSDGPLSATAADGELHIDCPGPVAFVIRVPDGDVSLAAHEWSMPGLTVEVATDAGLVSDDDTGKGRRVLRYESAPVFTLFLRP